MTAVSRDRRSGRSDRRLVLALVGAGPGLGAATARRFGAEGYGVGLVARDRARLSALAADLTHDGLDVAIATADAGRSEELRRALDQLAAAHGPPDVLVVSPLPDVSLIRPVLDTSAEDLLASLQLGVGAAATAAHQVLPAMRERGRGTVLLTSGSGVLTPSPARAASAVTSTALTTYVRLLHDAAASDGVHVAQVVIVGPLGRGLQHEPAAVADELWICHTCREEALIVLP